MLFSTGCHVHFEQSFGCNEVAHTMKMMMCKFLGIEYNNTLCARLWQYICQLKSYTSILTEVITNLYLPTPTNIFGYHWCENHQVIERAIIVVVCGYDISLEYSFHTKKYVTNQKTRKEYRVSYLNCRTWLNLKIIIQFLYFNVPFSYMIVFIHVMFWFLQLMVKSRVANSVGSIFGYYRN